MHTRRAAMTHCGYQPRQQLRTGWLTAEYCAEDDAEVMQLGIRQQNSRGALSSKDRPHRTLQQRLCEYYTVHWWVLSGL